MNINFLTELSKWLKGNIDFTNHSNPILRKLLYVAKKTGQPLYFTSSYRTPEQNVACGGSPTSSHLLKLAFDIKCTSSVYRYILLKTLFEYDIYRIGVYKNFIHIDFDTNKPQMVVWYD